ncbi:PREDICTED: platelet-activating factor receptor-like [Chrysochloris asiatica]|uniref:Platelet-activating factor receptor-like n=1 Tax=Chrysochloris asiatica TaxID=185453 RepID=A0A9B0TMT0_CHRAS|nr:PREDICTED: platelet-activating factor receptor-like [Chrysochloris asiatica]
MNNSVGDLGTDACSPWDDPARFIVVPVAYALALGLGLPANVAALTVFVRSSGRLGQALRLYLLNLALADVLFTLTLPLWLTYYLGLAHWPFPEAACRAAGAAYYVSTYAAVAFAVLISVCRCGSVRGPGPSAAGRLALRRRGPARAACATAWLAGLACAAPSVAAPHALLPGPGGSARCLEHGWARSGLAYATVAFFAAAFLLVLAAYVSLVRALATPSGPGPAPAGPHRRAARTMVLGLLLVFALCLAPYHLLLAPWIAGQESAVGDDGGGCRAASTLDVLHTLSLALLSLNSCLDPLIYCFSVRRFRQDCWALSCRPGLGHCGTQGASFVST